MRSAMPTRSGAALIIALVVLAALLLLGLPFLFTQSSSLAGTRSFSHSQQALIGRASAENIGVAASAAAMDWHWQLRPNGLSMRDEWTSLYWGLSNGGTLAEVRRLGETRVGLDLRQGDSFRPDPASTEPTISGVTISDEHGKLDPNHLDSSAWRRLLEQVGVKDWDDGTPPTPDLTRNQLARALADLRFQRIGGVPLIPGGRITRLDQLLLAEPPQPTIRAKWRHGLTRAELAQLAPHLSLHGMAQARSGLIDLGTVINNAGTGVPAIPDSVPPGALLAHAVFPSLVGSGTVIVDANDDGGSPGVSQPDTRDTTLTSPGLSIKGRALAIEAPPAVNLHEASAIVRKVLFDVPAAKPPLTAADPPTPSALTGLTTYWVEPPPATSPPAGPVDALQRPRTWFDLLDPLGIVQEVISANAFGSRPGEPGVSAGAPALPNPASGANETVVVVGVPTFGSALTIEATAQNLHLTGSQLNRLPMSGYARLDGLEVPGDPLTQPGVTAREYVYFSSSSASGTTATLANVTRGVALPPGSGTASARRFFVNGLKITILSARELPPLAIASPGIVTVETAATATDPAGRQTAQQARTVVAQTVAQEFPLEARWERQAHFHATLAQRQGSLLASFPAAVDRVQGRLPEDVPPPAPTPPGPDPYFDQSVGVRPAVLRTLLSSGHLFHEWTAPLAGRENGNNITDALRGGPYYGQRAALNYSTSDLFPEGVRLSTSRRLAWMFASSGNGNLGFFKHPAVNNGMTTEIVPSQFGFWVRPDATWAGRTEPVILFEVRGPIANAGRALLGTPTTDPTAVNDARLAEGSTALQNYLGLVWYPGTQEFVLAFGTGAIEHVTDYGPAIPSDNYAITTVTTESKSPAVDNASLGSDPVRYHRLAPARPQNRIEHRYHFDATSLRPGTWHLIQVAFSGTRPDHASIVVDGLVGRRVDESAAATADGDHYAMPRLKLATALAETHQNFATQGASVYRVDAIELTGPAAQVLPKRGMVYIGNEYISYQRLTGNTLQNCWRGRRQDSISGSKPTITEAHAVGDDVYPGGYRTMVPSLYTGGNTLAGPLSNGDTRTGPPTPTPHPYQVWGAVKPPAPVVFPATTFAVPDSGDLALQLYADALNDQFPSRGYVLINNDELAFYTRDLAVNPPLLQILDADRWQSIPSIPSIPITPSRPNPVPHVHNLSATSPASTPITLVSAELVGPDPTVDGRFPPANSAQPGLLQLYDANGVTATHRAEWIQYHTMATRSGGVSFVINYNGFDAGQRGQIRTAFAPRDLGDPTFIFPTGTRVLPVQTGTHLAETGDVLTIARQRLSKVAGEQPWQAVVRFAEKDGWGSPDPMTGVIPVADPFTGKPFDTSNRRIAFCEAIPDHFAKQTCHALCWPGWTSPRDLTTVLDPPNDNPANILDLLPWGNAWATGVLEGNGSAPTDDRRIYLGSDDERTTHNVAGNPTTMAIDAVWSGSQPAQGTGSLSVTEVYRSPSSTINPTVNPDTFWIINAETPTDLTGATLAIPGLPGTNTDYLLASVGGEVMALRHLRDPMNNNNYTQRASIVGRALFGSTALNHHGREPVLILPLGPVTPLLSTLSPSDQDAAPFATLDAPAVMIMDADGSSSATPELLMTPNGRTAPWLRGMYGTPINTWTVAGGSPAPLAVGWWPRYPSSIPHVSYTTAWGPAGPQRTAWTNAQLRSRSYAWAGFPLRFHDASFYASGTNGAPIVSASDFLGAQIEVIDDADGLYQIHVRALAAGFEWQQAPIFQPLTLGVSDVSNVFASNFFRRSADGTFRTGVSWKRNDPIPVDGAELRVTWSKSAGPAATSMQGALLDLARHNRAPMIGSVRLRCRAPTQVLSVEAAR